ncbi:MAG TPA: hypothetical protein VJ951_07020 [Bacteroidales bacterium]|nr:hypothetical protein [Bacteroidales bacterium]
MKQEGNDIRGILKDKMAGFEPDPPADVWSSIKQGLREKSRRRIYFYMIPVAAGIILAMGIGISLLFDSSNVVDEIATDDTNVVLEDSTVKEPSDTEGDYTIPAGTGDETPATLRSPGKSEKMENSISEQQVDIHDRSGRISRLEKKVVEEMREVMEVGEQDGVLVASFDKQNDLEDDELDETGDEGDRDLSERGDVGDRVDIPGDDDAIVIAQLADRVTVVNEDSLLQLLQPAEEGLGLTEDDEKEDKVRWQLGASLAPLYSYRDVGSTDMHRNSVVNNSESARITYSAGMSLGFLQSDRLSFESGLYYSKMGVKIGGSSEKNALMNLFDNNTVEYDGGNGSATAANSMGTIVDKAGNMALSNYGTGDLRSEAEYADNVINSTSGYGLVQSMGFIEVPLRVRYLIIDRGIKLQLTGGLSTNILLSSNASLENGDSNLDLGEIQDLRILNYSGNAGIGIIYDLATNMNLLMEPSFRYHLNSVNTTALPSTRPFAFGLFTGLTYEF